VNVGTQLRESREARRLSLDALSRTIRVQPRVLTAIEQNDPSAIPPRPFGRGFVHAYAREVGLDPEGTVREYFSQFAAPPVVAPEPVERSQPRTALFGHSIPWPAVGAIVAVALIAAMLVRASQRPPRDAGAVGTSGSAVAAATPAPPEAARQPVDRPVAPERTSPPAPPASVEITIAATAPCWVTATADGQRIVYQLMKPGDRSTLKGTKDVTILAGDAGALTWTINGRHAGALGERGAVRTVRVNPANAGSIR
jgi:cytoskeletal protein RodZ